MNANLLHDSHWLTDLKLNISTHSKAFQHLRNLALQNLASTLPSPNLASLSNPERNQLLRKIENEISKSDAYLAAQADAMQRLSSYLSKAVDDKTPTSNAKSACLKEQIENAMTRLIMSRSDLVYELGYCLNRPLTFELRRLAYWEILRDDALHARKLCDGSLLEIEEAVNKMQSIQTKNSNVFQISQSFLASRAVFSRVAMHFRCLKRMETVILYFMASKQVSEKQLLDDPALLRLCTFSVPIISAYNDAQSPTQSKNESWNDLMVLEVIMGLQKRLPEHCLKCTNQPYLSQTAFNVERYLSEVDQKLLSYLQQLFGAESNGLDTIVSAVLDTLFIGTYSLELSLFIMDQFIVASNDLNPGLRLPSVEMWKDWLCTCVLTAFSNELQQSKSKAELISRLLNVCMPQLQISELQNEMERCFISSFRKTNLFDDYTDSRKMSGSGIYKSNAVTWIWDENVVPLSEKELIERESFQINKDLESWDRSRREKVLFQKRKRLLQRWRKVARAVIIWIRFVQIVRTRMRQSKKESISERKKREEDDRQRLAAAAAAAEKKEKDHRKSDASGNAKPVEEEAPKLSRIDSSKKMEEDPLKQSLRTDTVLPPVIENSASSGIFIENSCPPGQELEHLSEWGKLIVRTIQGVETVFGGTNSGGSKAALQDVKESLYLSRPILREVKNVQLSIFKKELTPAEIMDLPDGSRLLYFKALDNLLTKKKKDGKGAAPKSSSLEELTQEFTVQNIVVDVINGIEKVFAGNSKTQHDMIRAAQSGTQVWQKWESDAQKKVWGRSLTQEEFQLWLRPDQYASSEDLLEQEQERRQKRDLFLKRMEEKKAKWV